MHGVGGEADEAIVITLTLVAILATEGATYITDRLMRRLVGALIGAQEEG